LVIFQNLASLDQKLLQSFAFLDVEKVKIDLLAGHIVKAQVALEEFGLHQLFAGADLVEELVEHFEMGEALGHLVALYREVLVCTVSNHFHHASVVLF
jgi:hypothetical protein